MKKQLMVYFQVGVTIEVDEDLSESEIIELAIDNYQNAPDSYEFVFDYYTEVKEG